MTDSKALEILFELAYVVADPDTQFLQQLIDDVDWRSKRFPAEAGKHSSFYPLFDMACKHWQGVPWHTPNSKIRFTPEQVGEAFSIVTFLIELGKRADNKQGVPTIQKEVRT